MRKFMFTAFLGAITFCLSGCFETNFNFKTVVHRNGRADREVRIWGRGANRFLPPEGASWSVKQYETKGTQTILPDIQYHLEARGRFSSPGEITSDFRYDSAGLVQNVTEEARREFIREIGIPEPFEREIQAANKIEFALKRHFWTTDYEYTETFQNRWLIPILIHDLKKEIIRQETVKVAALETAAEQSPEMAAKQPSQTAAATTLPTALLAPEKIEALAQEKLKTEILPQFRFRSELVLPGRIRSANTSHIQGHVAVWDFRGVDFEKNYSTFVIRAASRAVNLGAVFACAVFALVAVLALVMSRSREPKRKKKGKQFEQAAR